MTQFQTEDILMYVDILKLFGKTNLRSCFSLLEFIVVACIGYR